MLRPNGHYIWPARAVGRVAINAQDVAILWFNLVPQLFFSLTVQFTMLQADQVVCDNTFCPEDADEVGCCM